MVETLQPQLGDLAIWSFGQCGLAPASALPLLPVLRQAKSCTPMHTQTTFIYGIFFVCSAGGSMSHNTGMMQLWQSRDKHLLGPRGAGRIDWSLDQ